jgi:hypothetical protein
MDQFFSPRNGNETDQMDWKRQMEGFGGRNLSLEACKTPEDVNLGAPKVIVGMDT